MSDDERTCPEGYTPSDLLELLDGSVVNGRLNALEAHVCDCVICTAELASLKQIHELLIRHPESFHPDGDKLYQYAHSHEPSDANIAEHVLTCPQCQEDVEIIREMIKLGGVLPEKPEPIPQSLLDRLESSTDVAALPKQPGSLFNAFIEFYRSMMHRPILAMGTAAAVLLVIVVIIPYVKKPQVPIVPESVPLPSTVIQDREKTATEPAEDKITHVVKPTPKKPAAPGRTYQVEPRKMKPKLNFAMPEKGGLRLKRESLAEGDVQQQKKEGSVGSAKPAPVSTVKQTGDVHRYSPKHTNLKSRRRAQMEVSKQDLDKEVRTQPSDISSTMEDRVQPSKIRVNVKIIGTDGAQMPHIEFTPPPSLKSRYTFAVSIQAISEAKEHKTAELYSGISEPKALSPSERNLTVLVRISKLNGSYKIWADIVDSKSLKKGGTIEEIGVSQDELGRRIGSAVSSLIKKMDFTESQK